MKLMGPGMGFFLCAGTGIGIGLFSGPYWLLLALI